MIHVEGIGKRYRLTEGGLHYDTLRDTIAAGARRLVGKGGLRRHVSDFWALREVSFDVAEGEVVGIVGRNGAGKSTLLKILSRITPPTEGHIRLKGRVASLLEVGTGFHPELTGRENIFMNGAVLGMAQREIRRKLDEIVAFSEVEKFLETPVKHYSSGMYVRLAFAVAAHLEPEILIVDEVLAVGDVAFQQKCLGKMGEVARGGRTVLFVSHNMAAVENLCGRAILLGDGRLMGDGNASEVIASYCGAIRDSGSSGDVFSVSHRVLERQDATEFRIEGIELLDAKGETLNRFRTWDTLVVRIHYSAARQFVSPAFAVIVRSDVGQELIRLNTRPISGYEIPELAGDGHIDLTIESLPLTGGDYYLDVGFARERHYWVVRLQDVVKLSVESWDVYDSGIAMDSSRGLLAVPHRWELRRQHRAEGQVLDPVEKTF